MPAEAFTAASASAADRVIVLVGTSMTLPPKRYVRGQPC
jgi:hypothetical protein